MRVSNENVTKYRCICLKRVQTKGIIPFDRIAICLVPMVAMAADFYFLFILLTFVGVLRLSLGVISAWRRSWLISVSARIDGHVMVIQWKICEFNYMRVMKRESKKKYARTHRSQNIIINDNRWTGGAKENELAVYLSLMNA